MTYVSKKEKVFALPEQEDSSGISLASSETRLKRFPSVNDRRAWTSEECQRYQHFYGLVNGSETNISKSSSFKYIPFDVLLAILMAEKDAYIQELLENQEERPSYGGKLYEADGFNDSDDDRDALIRKDAEMVALKNKIAGLESELEDYRETLTKAMHKLETMDTVLNENNLLKEKIKCSEETIKCLEERKAELERQLEYYRKNSDSDSESNDKRPCLENRQNLQSGDCEEVARLSSERDVLIKKVAELQKELERVKASVAEVEVLRKLSETTSNSLEEVSRENECYKKKLESMKCLEKYIEELKKQGQTLAEKYKRESQKVSDQLKQINMNAKELQMLREERERLQMRVHELTTYESQYMSLQAKLQQVELILDENEILNKKLIHLDKLELENDQLKMKIEELQSSEAEVAQDKERIIRLQCAVVEQEEEIRKMLRQIEELSQGYTDKNEVLRMRNEIEEKNGKLRQYEKQLAEIPILESEIDELKNKLQNCIDNFKTDKDLLKRLQEELEACQSRCHELETMSSLYPLPTKTSIHEEQRFEEEEEEDLTSKQNNDPVKPILVEKGENTTEILKNDTESQCEAPERKDQGTEALSDFSKQLEKLEKQNQVLREEVKHLETKLSEIDLDSILTQTNELKQLLQSREGRIKELEDEVTAAWAKSKTYEDLKKNFGLVEEEKKRLEDVNRLLEEELKWRQLALDQAKGLEDSLRLEKKGRECALNLVKELENQISAEKEKRLVIEMTKKLQKEEENMAKQELYLHFSLEISSLKTFNCLSQKLSKELKKENQMLRDIIDLSDSEKKSLKDLVCKLQAEVNVLRSLSKPELEGECEALQIKVKKLAKEIETLVEEIQSHKSALAAEKEAKDYLEKELTTLQAELSACVTAGNEVFAKEMATKDSLIARLEKELSDAKYDLENSANEAQALRDENVKLFNNYNNLKSQQKDMESELNWVSAKLEELKTAVKNYEEKNNENSKIMNSYQEEIESLKKEIVSPKKEIESLKKEIEKLKENRDELCQKIKILENSVKVKEEEAESSRKMYLDAKNEMNKLKSQIEVLKCRLSEKDGSSSSEIDYERDLEEKYALEEALRKMEGELDEVKVKLKESKDKEDEMVMLKSKRDSSLQKMSSYESEIEMLKKELANFESLKVELEELKAGKKSVSMEGNESSSTELLELSRKLGEKTTEAENLKMENENLREELSKMKASNSENSNTVEDSKTEKLTEICEKIVLESQVLSPTAEFYTPPALPSPHSSEFHESELETQNLIPFELHKKELMDLENQYKNQIEKLKEANADKLKKLMIQHESELKCRSKAFHDNLNTVKFSYESDIRRLVEKHKSSIMRLQSLHEDEVQELNTNYETQMEAMQTQNENVINDLRTESAEKYKQLVEQHNREIRDLEAKYEKLMCEKEAQCLANAESNLSKSANDIKEVHKQAVDSLTQFYQTSILELEEKHNKELKKCKKNNLKLMELMKNKYEDLLVEERKKYEEQLEEMLHQLKKGEQGDVSEEEIKQYSAKKIPPTTNPRLEFVEVLQKILNEGLESLTFEELILVHSKTCFLPETISDDAGGTGEHPRQGGVGETCKHKGLMAAEKEELLKRIFTLEHEIVIKQLETHEAIVNLENAEKYRVQELKNALAAAQEKNLELKRLISNQTKLQMDMKIERYMLDRQTSLHETNILEKVKELEREKMEKRRLEEDLQKERNNVKHLTLTLETEKERFRSQRKRDSEYVESIRIRLEEALNHEQMMESQLDYEARFRAKLESELQALQKSFSLIAEVPACQLSVESKAVKDIKNLDQCENKKEERHSRSKSKHRSKSKTLHNL